ncbi:putative toxin-antitoxin system toxin component, PIN family [uncultured Thiohalocapsa sp.]|uniref:putative toxin-antitoxin system toxin component, PIN family n=1 Tax=uncultured Thiohalocapsa sp. TaxID=768990 RepID=UPI0025D12B2A|nr:putative toxin-antitoxin system toxin component, PIN family [uncultured Thiohalocapsa sp.]
MSPRVFVVDTNVLAAGLITGDACSPVARILDDMLSGAIVYLLSPALLDEYRAVLLRPKLSRLHGLTEPEVDALLTDLVANAIWRDPGPASPAPDPGDTHLWQLLEGHAGSILITGDRLLIEQPPGRASVISPRTYVERISGGRPAAE